MKLQKRVTKTANTRGNESRIAKQDSKNFPRIVETANGKLANGEGFLYKPKFTKIIGICFKLRLALSTCNSITEHDGEMKKRSRPRNIRKNAEPGSDEEDTSDIQRKLEEIRKSQESRKRPQGVNGVALAFGEDSIPIERSGCNDAFKLSTGGLVQLRDLKGEYGEESDDISKKLSYTFAAETKQRDEDKNMLSYIESEMTKRQGNKEADSEQDSCTMYEKKLNELYSIPDNLQAQKKLNSEEMLSNQILSGIPEFDLGMEEKFRNVEATELAVRQLVRDQMGQEEGGSSLIPTNIAANFSHYEQCKEGAGALGKGRRDISHVTTVDDVAGKRAEINKKQRIDKSSDDYHYEKFIKKSKRF